MRSLALSAAVSIAALAALVSAASAQPYAPAPYGPPPYGAPPPYATAPPYAPPPLPYPPPAGPLAGPGATPGYVVPPFNEIGTGQSLPTSNRASNIDSADTRSLIAPRLPTPPVGDDATFRAYLSNARQALSSGQTGVAQEALERAETRLLDRSVAPSRASDPIAGPEIQRLGQARHAIAAGDLGGAIGLIDSILAAGPPPLR